jgi:branched-chain amino acid transport system permease protein
LTSLPEFLVVFENYETSVFGLILILVMIFMPRGLLRGLEDLVKKLIGMLRKDLKQRSLTP